MSKSAQVKSAPGVCLWHLKYVPSPAKICLYVHVWELNVVIVPQVLTKTAFGEPNVEQGTSVGYNSGVLVEALCYCFA